jgi:hypothetical protein
MKILFVRFLAVAFLLFLAGCNRDAPQPDEKAVQAASTQSVEPKIAEKEKADAGKTDVVKIVFVGQKNSCECTQKRIAETWKSLETALKNRKDITVEKIQLDVEEEQAEKLDDLKSIMVAPGLYFFDANENLVEMLQGELTAEQIKKVL